MYDESEEIKKGLENKIDMMARHDIYIFIQNPKQHLLKMNEKNHEKNILIWSECIRISDGDFPLIMILRASDTCSF